MCEVKGTYDECLFLNNCWLHIKKDKIAKSMVFD